MIATRSLERSGLQLTEIGLGCATFAFDGTKQAVLDSRALLSDALESGVHYFDTAPFYGRGLSERMVGDAIRSCDKGLTATTVLSSKVGRLLTPDSSASTHMPFRVDFDYSYDGIMRSVEHSYQRTGLSKIDIIYVHDLGQQTHGKNASVNLSSFFDDGGYRALEELRNAGDVKAFGLGVNEIAICQQVMQRGSFDLFLLAGRYTLLERTEALEFFNQCSQANTDIVIGGPFNSGMLVGGSTYNYRSIPDNMAARLKVLSSFCEEHNVELGAAALQFPLRHRSVKSVIPGPKTPKEFAQIMYWYNTDIADSFWTALEKIADEA